MKSTNIQLVLIRHGESQWNKENRFTGWVDIGLSEKGCHDAKQAGKFLKKEGFVFDCGYTSVLKRAIHTLWIIMDELNQTWLPVKKSWRLNERHYGSLQGMNKCDVIKKYGAEQVKQWRRSFFISPPQTDADEVLLLRKDPRYVNLNFKELPRSESLSLALNRILPYWTHEIFPQIKNKKSLIVSVHGNTIRAILKFLNNLNDDEIIDLNIPTGIPIVCEFDPDINFSFIKFYYLRIN
ncbi:2,3-diphosphoglycerate-dependent phosphoglycerate mutase [Blochmannia endosymbiont of Polyrhachis (Hedomyrma) turneri]|uniref:2,3-diphosphoglycerate-dependent phosphoglycerate mutase n=1 Tax=Blochmannia endosymbiont of Polyrhachis (Hedomyrma) turneri TaxID=1505596 RepID=UPI00061B4AB5|nr:2,3-diphosphoglycerate-dependent phosphoglycerate mutase [Blochmannia endosymbiont of Polyrhachis (Hedomyrma) turneri]